MEEFFKNKNIEAKKIINEYEFFLDDISYPIKIRIYYNIYNGKYSFIQNYHIHTPNQAGPYVTSRPWNDSEETAVMQAVNGYTTYYDSAKKEGHKPKDSWLVKNEEFYL